MKHLYLIGGTMGVGKTATGQALKARLANCAFLDGDWCWDMHPFMVTDETKRMVMENICFVLSSFLRCSAFDNIVFCWVMHRQEIVDDILSRLDTAECAVHALSLVCREDALVARISRDVAAGRREAGGIGRSVDRLPLYQALNTVKLDVSDITAVEAAGQIARMSLGDCSTGRGAADGF
ncbi:MAG: AAA family ATPase [Clostridiales bacterium]|nr:AAA family ATPase [Clostridiales bacterium]